MGAFVKGDVVVAPFPFSDLSAAKKRPALVLATLSGNDVILCQITSQAVADSYAVPLRDGDFSIILYRAGTISSAKMQEVLAKLVQILTM